jgi:hypothetical protein
MEKENSRKFVESSAFGIATASFIYCACNWFLFKANHPDEPNQQSGLIYPFNIKGHPVFISAADLNFNAVCSVLCIGFGFLFAVLFSKRIIARTPWQTDDEVAGSVHHKIIIVSFLITAGLLYLFGRKLADLLVNHDIILVFFS